MKKERLNFPDRQNARVKIATALIALSLPLMACFPSDTDCTGKVKLQQGEQVGDALVRVGATYNDYYSCPNKSAEFTYPGDEITFAVIR